MKVLLAIDGGPLSEELVCEVLAQAWPAETCFAIVHVSEPMHVWAQMEPVAAVRAHAEKAVQDALFAISQHGFRASVHMLAGDAKTEILNFADRMVADLILTGTSRHSILGRLLLGSVSSAVLRHANCSVQIVRPRPHEFRAETSYRVLLAADGSAMSMQAAQSIAARPWQSGSEARIISAIELLLPPTLTLLEPGEPGFPPNHNEFEQAKQAARTAAEQAAMILSPVFAHPTFDYPVVTRSAKHAILAEAERWEANCIFLGSHGMKGLNRFLLGSVSEAVATHAHCCVEVVR